MAMPSGNVVIADKMHFPSGGGGVGGGEIHPHQQQGQWFPDERDGFISWLRGEFAAANAIIDSLCHHLGAVGEPGEYDTVVGYIQQRRCNWNPVLYMQQYFSVSEVVVSLQQVAIKRQQQRYFDQTEMGGNKEFNNGYQRSGGTSFKHQQGPRSEPGLGKEVQNAASENCGLDRNERASDRYDESKAGGDLTNVRDKALADTEDAKVAKTQTDVSCGNSKSGSGVSRDRCAINTKDENSTQNQDERNSLISVPKTFVGTEIFDGKPVNVVDGLKLYEEMIDDGEISKLVSVVNDMRAAGKKGQLQGNTYVVSKRPMKGHGREVIQLGHPIADILGEDENVVGTTSKERKLEPIPASLQGIVDRLVGMQLVPVKPDSCIIDFFSEGDHSQPHTCPSWYGRPVCMLFLTECVMSFGENIVVENPGDFRGSLKLSLAPGSLLAVQGKSADLARHAIHSVRRQRIILTFTKSQPKKSTLADVHRQPSAAVTPSPHWGPLPSRSPNHLQPGLKHYALIPTNGVLPAPSYRGQMAPPNSVQPMFVPAAVPYPASVPMPPGANGWPAPPRHVPPRFPLPGTGVFLPPQSSTNSTHQQSSTTATETSFDENGSGKANQASGGSQKGKFQKQDCNRTTVDEATSNGKTIEQKQNLDNAVASKSANTV